MADSSDGDTRADTTLEVVLLFWPLMLTGHYNVRRDDSASRLQVWYPGVAWSILPAAI